MEYEALVSAVEQMNGDRAIIQYRRDPSQEFLAEIEYCGRWKGVGYVYLFWVDRRTLSVYGEGLSRLKADDVISLRRFENNQS